MNKLHKSTLALAVVAAFAAVGTATAGGSLMTVAHPTFMHHGDAIMGALPQSQPIRFSVSVKMRDRAGLDAFIANMGKHPGQVMSTAQFMASHAPTQAQVARITSWLQGQGFTDIVVAPNHLLISATGNAGQVSRAFNTTMAQFRTHDGRIAFGNTTEARIPTSQPDMLGVVGLQNVNMGHTFFKVLKPKAGAHTMAVTGHNPTDFDTIYGASSATSGSGVTVGIFTQGKITQSITDLNTFTSNNGLPTVPTQTVNTNGTGSDTSGVGEWDLDSQDIVGIAGGVAKIIWYNTPTLSEANMDANFNTIVSANAVKIINVSIGGCETGADYTTSDQIFSQGVAQGQTFSISTGDSGADECGNGGTTPSWPANSQYVVAASGTRLNATTGSSAAWSSETVWSDSGGSESKYEPKPSWQTLWTGTHRGVADVAFDGDPNSGATVIVSGASQQIGGTSLSAPLFAGMWTRVLATKGSSVGFAGPIIYQLPASAFHDITSGSNGITAKAGYDLASGRGSMILSTALANWPGGGGGGNTPPTANFSFSTNALTATFTDSSSDSDGSISSHSWTFGDGGTSTATNPSHTYSAAGTYSVTETVTDNDGATASKTSSVTVSSGGGGGGSSQLLANTSFESTGSWTGSSGVICSSGCSGESAHTGNGFAWLDGYGSTHTDTLSQAVTIPSTATTATVSYYLHVDTAETTTSSKYDKLYVRLYNGSKLVKTLATFSNLNHNSGYTKHSNSVTVSSYHGKSLTLKITGSEDSSLQTSFVLDDVTMTVQ